jgi:hypothetical protein
MMNEETQEYGISIDKAPLIVHDLQQGTPPSRLADYYKAPRIVASNCHSNTQTLLQGISLAAEE